MRPLATVVGLTRRMFQKPGRERQVEAVEERAVVEHSMPPDAERIAGDFFERRDRFAPLIHRQDQIARPLPRHRQSRRDQRPYERIEHRRVDPLHRRHPGGIRRHHRPHHTSRPEDHRRPATRPPQDRHPGGITAGDVDLLLHPARRPHHDHRPRRHPGAHHRFPTDPLVSLLEEGFVEGQRRDHVGATAPGEEGVGRRCIQPQRPRGRGCGRGHGERTRRNRNRETLAGERARPATSREIRTERLRKRHRQACGPRWV